MITRVKDFLGIEGVRLELILNEEPSLESGKLHGIVRLSSLRRKEVTQLSLRLDERYERGRGDEKLIDTYTLGALDTDNLIEVMSDQQVDIPFELIFSRRLSPIERAARRSPLLKPATYLIKLAGAAQSTYVLRAEATVAGTSLHPQARLDVEFS